MRVTTINVDKFQHDGLVADRGWTDFRYAKADAKAQESFCAHVGRFIRIHPEDVGELAGLGLTLDGDRIVEAPKPGPAAPVDPVPAPVDGKADDGKGKGKTK